MWLSTAPSAARSSGGCCPHLGHLAARSLSAPQLARARDALAEKYSPGTVRTTLIPLSAALSWGVTQGLLEQNPVKGLGRPRAVPQMEWLSAVEVRRLLTLAEQQARTAEGTARLPLWSLWAAAALALYTGLRRGEIFGLRWQDVDEGTQRLPDRPQLRYDAQKWPHAAPALTRGHKPPTSGVA